MKNPGKSWRSHGKVTHDVVKFLQLRNSVINVSSECVDNVHYYTVSKKTGPLGYSQIFPTDLDQYQ